MEHIKQLLDEANESIQGIGFKSETSYLTLSNDKKTFNACIHVNLEVDEEDIHNYDLEAYTKALDKASDLLDDLALKLMEELPKLNPSMAEGDLTTEIESEEEYFNHFTLKHRGIMIGQITQYGCNYSGFITVSYVYP